MIIILFNKFLLSYILIDNLYLYIFIMLFENLCLHFCIVLFANLGLYIWISSCILHSFHLLRFSIHYLSQLAACVCHISTLVLRHMLFHYHLLVLILCFMRLSYNLGIILANYLLLLENLSK